MLETHLPECERLAWLGRPSRKPPGASETVNYAAQKSANLSLRIPCGIQNNGVNGGFTGVYKSLARDPSTAVRTRLAEQLDSIPFTPSERDEIQSILLKDPFPSVRSVLAGSRKINRLIHFRLSLDPEFEVRCALASNPFIIGPGYLKGWKRLMAAGHAEQIAHNPGCPESLRLACTAHGSVD